MHETFYKREHVEKVFTLGDFLTIIRKAHSTITSNKSFIGTGNKYLFPAHTLGFSVPKVQVYFTRIMIAEAYTKFIRNRRNLCLRS